MEYVASGVISHGTLKLFNLRGFFDMLRTLKDGTAVTVTIERQHATRSMEANRYYWGVVLKTLSDYTGHSVDELHEICKIKFMAKTVALADGNGEIVAEYVVGATTTKLNTVQFYEYVERIRGWAHETLNCYIPGAGEAAA